jgi:FtsZ-interacting cell division protein YlmF
MGGQSGGSPLEATMGGQSEVPVKTYMAEVSGKIYNIRIPEFGNGVHKDWLNEIYTDDEADFLNSMNLRPKMMDEVFPMSLDPKGGIVGVKWQVWVANFLQNMVTSQCFTDESLMTNRECMTSRDFMNRVFNYFADKDLQSDTLHEYEDAAADDAELQYKKAQQNAESAKRRAAFQQPDAEKAAPMSAVDFSKEKKRWGTLDVLTDPIKKQQTTQILMIDKTTGKQSYKSIAVPLNKYPEVKDAAEALLQNIDTFRKKYPGFLFIY